MCVPPGYLQPAKGALQLVAGQAIRRDVRDGRVRGDTRYGEFLRSERHQIHREGGNGISLCFASTGNLQTSSSTKCSVWKFDRITKVTNMSKTMDSSELQFVNMDV